MNAEKIRALALYAAALLTIVLPIAASVRLAYTTNEHNYREKALQAAHEVLHRAEQITEQLQGSFDLLHSLKDRDPCSPQGVALMRRAVIQSDMLIDVGYVRDDKLVCSSFGSVQLDIGPASYTSRAGYVVRQGVHLASAPAISLIITTEAKTGFSGLIHDALPVAVVPQDQPWTAALVGKNQRVILSRRGNVDPEWIARAGRSASGSYINGEHVVAWEQSRHHAYFAIAALPRSGLDAAWKHSAILLGSIGLGSGILLAIVLSRLARKQTSIASMLRHALRTNELYLVYQPVVDLTTGAWVGAEALIRWRGPKGDRFGPDVFIPIAEQAGLMPALTERVLQILEKEAAPLFVGRPGFHVAINVSSEDFRNGKLVARLRQVLEHLGCVPDNLRLEATEHAFMRVKDTYHSVEALRDSGFAVLIDDFGIGYSSLAYLTNFTFDYLKIDRSFVDTIGTDSVTSNVIEHIIEMAKSLHIAMIAEGVETENQAGYLRKHGVQYAQGWFFAHPMRLEDLKRRLDR